MVLKITLSTTKTHILRNMKSKWEEQRDKFLKTEFMNGNKMMVINMLRSLRSEVNLTINFKLWFICSLPMLERLELLMENEEFSGSLFRKKL